ncbi:MAG: hypothetical protein J2O48_07935 [Solirubrobacterales bacterium]|nr:hypothetical protein [Solirubrobacterales bacterium]
MDLVRLRWRLRGAWQWPSVVALTLADALIVHWLPPSGDSESLVGGWLIGLVLTLIALCLLVPLGGFLIRKRRPDLPRVVARNYAGALSTLLVSLALLAAGIANQATIRADHTALLDASQRAEAWIGFHAPARFQRNVQRLDTFQIQPQRVFRSCVSDGPRYYCVVVDRSKPWGSGVRYDGSESNTLLSQGTD